MKPKRIVFIPVIAVIAGFSAFVAVLLICLDLFPAIAGEREGVARASEKHHEFGEVGRAIGDIGAKANTKKKEGVQPSMQPPVKLAETRGHEIADHGYDGDPGERIGHLLEAAEHLQIAGFQDDAEQWRDRAEEMKRQIHAEAGDDRIESLVHRVEELQDAMRKMGEEMRRLQREADAGRRGGN